MLITFNLEAAFNMTYFVCPWTFSVQLASHVTVLSCLTSFHLCPCGGDTVTPLQNIATLYTTAIVTLYGLAQCLARVWQIFKVQ